MNGYLIKHNYTDNSITQILKRGVALIIDDNDKLYGIYRTPSLQAIKEWRRGLPFANTGLQKKILLRLKEESIVQIRNNDFRKVYFKLKKLQQAKTNTLININILAKSIQFLVVPGHEPPLFTEMPLPEKIYESIELWHDENRRRAVRDLKLLPAAEIESMQSDAINRLTNFIERKIKNLSIQDSIMLTSDSFKQMSFWGRWLHSLSEKQISLKMVMAEQPDRVNSNKTRKKHKNLNRVLVITNLNGSFLKYVNEGLEFYGRGVKGFQWRHVFGKLTHDRFKTCFGSKPDILIYRGHALVKNQRIFIPLADGEAEIPLKSVYLYMHLACTDISTGEDLLELPGTENLVPVSYMRDKNDSEFVQELFSSAIENQSWHQVMASVANRPGSEFVHILQ